MRWLGTLPAVGIALAISQAPVDAQCGLFSAAANCHDRTESRFRVDFTPASKPQTIVVPSNGLTVVVRRPHTGHSNQAIDCQMARAADPAVDPKFETLPPAGVKQAMRVLEVPACAARSTMMQPGGSSSRAPRR